MPMHFTLICKRVVWMTTESHNNSKKRQQVLTGKIEEGGKVEFPRVATKSGLIGHGIYIECIIKYHSAGWN